MEGEDNIALSLKDVPSKVTSSSILFWADALALQNISDQVISPFNPQNSKQKLDDAIERLNSYYFKGQCFLNISDEVLNEISVVFSKGKPYSRDVFLKAAKEIHQISLSCSFRRCLRDVAHAVTYR
jgi:hypothetical protein